MLLLAVKGIKMQIKRGLLITLTSTAFVVGAVGCGGSSSSDSGGPEKIVEGKIFNQQTVKFDQPLKVGFSVKSNKELDGVKDVPSGKSVLEVRYKVTNRGTNEIPGDAFLTSLSYNLQTDPAGKAESASILFGDCNSTFDQPLAAGKSGELCNNFLLDNDAKALGLTVKDSSGPDGKVTVIPFK